jgi:hypothetical protein
MKLMHIRIKDFRSFSGEHDFDVSSGVNYFVGPNNCGKSNLVRALELALDPDAVYVPDKDRPARPGAVGAPPTTRITLTFQVGKTSPEATLLKRANEYELAVRKARNGSATGKIQTYAADCEVRMVTSFAGKGGRQTTFQAKGFGAASLPADSQEHLKLEAQFRSVVRSAVVHSGEDLESLLKGKFRQILQLVIADHLGDELEKAEEARSRYLAALQAELLEPLRAQIQERVGAMFPEIAAAKLVPDLPAVAETLSSVDVQLGDDLVTTQLIDKGTGVRGAVLVSMLQYLAEQSRRSLVLAIEEPEAFLHPAAQEVIMGQLEDLATRTDVSLLVTTHSPYIISRRTNALITELRKRQDGVTSKAASCAGDQSRVELIGALYRDAGMAGVLERALSIPAGTRAVVITEGYTDGEFLRIACNAAGRPELLDGIHFIQAGGAKKVVLQAILARSATDRPVLALLDHDDQGRAAISKLQDFGWSKNQEILSLAAWPDKCGKGHDVEVEDLIPSSLWGDVIKRVGELDAIDSKQNCDGKWHYRISKSGKAEALTILPSIMKQFDAKPLVWLAEEINARIDKIEKVNAAARAYTKASAAS